MPRFAVLVPGPAYLVDSANRTTDPAKAKTYLPAEAERLAARFDGETVPAEEVARILTAALANT